MTFLKKGLRTTLFAFAITFLSFILADISCGQPPPNIMTWGTNQSPWGQQLGVIATREGCSDAPASCVASMDAMAKSQNVSKIYLSMLFDVSNSVSYAKQYSSLSLTHQEITEIGFDNFVGEIENLQLAGQLVDPGTFVSQVITATKSANPSLSFGVTLFEDQLTHAALQNAVLPLAVRSKVNFVHLYVHYRQNASNFASYVSQAKTIFPNAQIIAGAYPYDRIDYLPCQFGGKTPCTATQELSLYQQLLQTQATLAKQNSIFGIEFSFGYFGDPEDWSGWTQPRVCTTARLLQCYANTKTMQTTSKTVLHSTFPPSVSLQHTTLYMGSEYLKKLSTPGTMVLTNAGVGALTITSIGVAGTDSSEFPLKNNCPEVVAPRGNCTLTVYFEPIALGARQAQIIIEDDAGTGSQTITLTGTGIASSTSPTYMLSPSATQLAFGTVAVGSSTSKSLTLSNAGTSSVTISSVAVSGLGVSVKGVAAKTVLAPGQAIVLTVTYAPTAAGSLNGAIVIVSTATNSPATISVTGSTTTPTGTTHSATLTWAKSTSTVTAYRVYRGTVSGGPYTLLTSASLSSAVTSYLDSTVQSGRTYYYVTTAVNAVGQESGISNQVTAAIP